MKVAHPEQGRRATRICGVRLWAMALGICALSEASDVGPITPTPVLLVGSYMEDRIGAISVANGSIVVPFHKVSFPTASIYNIMVSPKQTFAIVPDRRTGTFRLLWSDGTSIEVSAKQEGKVRAVTASEPFVAVLVEREASLELRGYEFSEKVGFIDLGKLLELESGKWLWRASPEAIQGVGLVKPGEILVVTWELGVNEVRKVRLPEPEPAESGEWLELYDAQPVENGSQIFISGEWGIEGAGPADRADYLVIYDLHENQLKRSYAFWASEPSPDCGRRIYLVIGESLAALNARGERCGADPLPYLVGTTASGEPFATIGTTAVRYLPGMEGVTLVPDLMSDANLSDVRLGKIGQIIWFSWLSDRLWFEEKILDRVRFGMSGGFHPSTGDWWLFDPRGEWVFTGNLHDGAASCGVSSFVLDRAPTSGHTEPGSVVTAQWVLAEDATSGFPCLLLVDHGKTVYRYPLIDRRGEFPFSPTQEWDYTGIFRSLSYRTLTANLDSGGCDLTGLPDLSPIPERNLAGSLQWIEGSVARSAMLIVNLEQPSTSARRIIGLQPPDGFPGLRDENDHADLQPSHPRIFFSLEGENFRLEPTTGRILLRRRYDAFPSACLSRAPVHWEDIFLITPEGASYAGSTVADRTVPDESCLRAEVQKVLDFRKIIGESKQGGEPQ